MGTVAKPLQPLDEAGLAAEVSAPGRPRSPARKTPKMVKSTNRQARAGTLPLHAEQMRSQPSHVAQPTAIDSTVDAAPTEAPARRLQGRKQKRRAFFRGLARALFDPDSLRHVYVNGQRLDSQQLAHLDGLVCGEQFPDGNYWVNEANGTWGYVGQMAQRLPECDPAPVQVMPAQATPRAESDEELLERARNGQVSSEEHEEVMRRLKNETANSAMKADFNRWSNQQTQNAQERARHESY